MKTTTTLPIISRTLPVTRLLTGKSQQTLQYSTSQKIAKLNVDVIPARQDGSAASSTDQKHILFLHGLFGKG
jgi:hypothetical protein